MNNDFETDRLAQLIDQKHQCLVRLQQLGHEQLALVRDGRVTALLELLAYKQRVFSLLRKIETSMNPFRGQDPESRQWRSEEVRRRCRAQIAENEHLLAEIMAQEKTSEEEMVARRDDAAHELRGMQRKGQVATAYAQHVKAGR